MEEKLLTMEDVKESYKKLSEQIKEEAVQTSQGKETGKGYDTAGYGYQFLVNRMNEVLGPSHWRQIPEILSETKRGEKLTEVTMRITVQIGNWINGVFVPVAEQVAFGGHTAKYLSDAYKGAHTNALKKALGMFGVGKDAYEGVLDDDNRDPDYREQLRDKQLNKQLNDSTFGSEEQKIKVKLLSMVEIKKSKKGSNYAIAKIATQDGEHMQLVAFNNFEKLQKLKVNSVFTVIGHVDVSPVNGIQLIANDLVA